jgi:hypothetical protein
MTFWALSLTTLVSEGAQIDRRGRRNGAAPPARPS